MAEIDHEKDLPIVTLAEMAAELRAEYDSASSHPSPSEEQVYEDACSALENAYSALEDAILRLSPRDRRDLAHQVLVATYRGAGLEGIDHGEAMKAKLIVIAKAAAA